MSPEQAAGGQVDGRSDLYALGVVAYQALTGALPFTGRSAQAVLMQHMTQAPPSVAALAPGAPARLVQAIERCLAKDPAARFANGEELAAALAVALDVQRETPVPVRVFLRHVRGLAGGFTLWYVFLGPAAVGGFLADLIAGGFSGAGELVGRGALALAVLVGPIKVLLYQVRHLLKVGYDQHDVVAALRAEAELRREEAAFEFGHGPRTVDRMLWAGFAASSAVAVALALWTGLGAPPFEGVLLDILAASGFASATTGLIAAARAGRRKPAEGRAVKFWAGRVARWLFHLAGWRLKPRAVAAGGRPTELAIGGAAGALFAALPKATRRALGDLPALIRRLEDDARAARLRIEDLDRALARARAGAAGNALAELTAARETAVRRQGEVVAALETVRLQLLRLSADAGALAHVTADLARVEEVGREADRILAAREEAEAPAR
jgi:serine/threonine-protein kinase